jgi:hypothetical protein
MSTDKTWNSERGKLSTALREGEDSRLCRIPDAFEIG